MKNALRFVMMALALTATAAMSSTQTDLDAAVNSGKAAYVLVYDQSALQVDQARGLMNEAVARISGAVTIECDRNDPANADFVAKLRLAGAPVPLILVCSSGGVVTGGVVAQQATVEQLIKVMPSPKKSEIVKALSEGNAVMIIVSRKGMASAESVYSACASACQQLAGKAVQVKIDMDDPAEAGFLTDMKVNRAATEPVTLVANAQGQIAGMYTGAVQMADLVTAATKKVGGCCPSTVAKPDASCPPTKK